MNLNRFVYPRSSFARVKSASAFFGYFSVDTRFVVKGQTQSLQHTLETFFKTTTQPLVATNTKSFEKLNRHTAADSRLMTWCAMMKFPFIFWANNGMSCGVQRSVTSRLMNRAYLYRRRGDVSHSRRKYDSGNANIASGGRISFDS